MRRKFCSSDSSARCCGHPPATVNDNTLVFCFESSNLTVQIRRRQADHRNSRQAIGSIPLPVKSRLLWVSVN